MATILLIDDDISLLANLGNALEEAGYAVLRASTAAHGLQQLEPPPDLVILEVDTDQGAGWDALSTITAANIPVLVLTSRAREEEVVRALEAGAADVLSKPYRTNELLARLRTRLNTPKPKAAAKGRRKTNRRDADEEPAVFMDQAAERALLDQPADEPHTEPTRPLQTETVPIEALPLGERLRAARTSRRQSLVQVNLETKSNLAIWYLQAMEEEKFGLLPRGPLAAQMVREYADYLGLDADRAVAEFREHHDLSPFQPLPALGGRPEAREIPQWIWLMAGVVLALALSVGGLWYFAAPQLTAFGNNMRTVFAKPTATATPTPTSLPPTITPTASPTFTATVAPTNTPEPTATPTVAPTSVITNTLPLTNPVDPATPAP